MLGAQPNRNENAIRSALREIPLSDNEMDSDSYDGVNSIKYDDPYRNKGYCSLFCFFIFFAICKVKSCTRFVGVKNYRSISVILVNKCTIIAVINFILRIGSKSLTDSYYFPTVTGNNEDISDNSLAERLGHRTSYVTTKSLQSNSSMSKESTR